MSSELGVIGMGVMGLNLAMNAASKGLQVAVYNRTTSRMVSALEVAETQSLNLIGFPKLEDFVQCLQRPRRIILLVQAGKAVDDTLEALMKLLEKGDIVVDGGNEFYANTDRRAKLAAEHGIHFMGMGVSGGEEGARHGPSLMPGGDREAYDAMANVLTAIAAKSSFGVCVDYMGKGSAGNYVKMVHNGIEYGDMQLIAESYQFMRDVMAMKDNADIANVFKNWNQGRLESYLIEITATVLVTKHPANVTKYLLDDVLDVAGAKGTGKWTVQEACEKGVPCPTIQAALDMRNISGQRAVRSAFAHLFAESAKSDSPPAPVTTEELETALFLSKLCSYAQGLALIREASRVHGFEVDIAAVARCWSGGCIIRAPRVLGDIVKAFEANPALENLLTAREFTVYFTKKNLGTWKHIVNTAAQFGAAVPAMCASLNWFLTLASGALPLNLIQAQRDYFGAHTFALRSASGGSKAEHADWQQGVFKAAP